MFYKTIHNKKNPWKKNNKVKLITDDGNNAGFTENSTSKFRQSSKTFVWVHFSKVLKYP